MSLTYGGTTYRSLEEQVRKNMEDISTEAESLAALTDKVDNLKTGGEKVSLTFPAGASSGTVTSEQLATLQDNDANYIEMVNDKELYYLNDPGHVEGYLTYSHVGIENSKATIKTLTITVSAKSFVIVTTVVPTESGEKVYRHAINIQITADSGAPLSYNGIEMLGTFYSTSITKKTIDDFWAKNYLGIYRILHYKASGNVAVPASDYTVLSKDDGVIGLFEFTSYTEVSTPVYGYSASPTTATTNPALTVFNLTDIVTEI